MIQVETIEGDDHVIGVLRIEGELTAVTVEEFRRELAILLGQGILYYVLDLEAVEFIDSSGLGSIITITKRVRDLEGDVKLAALQPATKKVLKITKSYRYFPSYLTVDDALRNLNEDLSNPKPLKKEDEPKMPSRFRRWRWF